MLDPVLVLGASGTVGTPVALALRDAGYPVRCLTRHAAHRNVGVIRSRGCEILSGDLYEEDDLCRALEGCRFLVHCAAPYPRSGLRLRLRKPLREWPGALSVLMAKARSAGVERAVYTSTLSTIGLAPAGGLAHEGLSYDARRQARGVYYPVKAAMEEAALAADGPPLVVVNPTALVGEYSRNAELSAACVFFLGLSPLMFDAPLNFVDCRDQGRGHVLALQKGRPGERYILGGVNTTLGKFAALASGLSGRRPPRRVPRMLAALGAWAAETRGLLGGRLGALNLTSYYHLVLGQHYSSAKAQAELGYQQTADLTDAIRRELHWHAVAPQS
jgi:dihydroflavonol-4-reductase